jgi:CRISPR type III-B/RAMP module-associated protein Cmr3
MKYLLTFKPLKPFFFGNNRTLSDDEHLAVSEHFPQNTQLLGALRLFVAEQSGLLPMHKNGRYPHKKERLKQLTGTATIKDFEQNDDLGAIGYLSGMFVVSKGLDDAYFPTPYDLSIDEKRAEIWHLGQIGDNCYVEGYDAKKPLSQYLGGKAFWHAYTHNQTPIDTQSLKPFSHIFREHTQVGIALERKRVVDEKFYRKIDYTLTKGYLLAALLEWDDARGVLPKEGTMQIGADGSMFAVRAHAFDSCKGLHDHPAVVAHFERTEVENARKYVALSDAMLPSTRSIPSLFAIIPHITALAMLDAPRGRYRGKTRTKRLVPSGSVFYVGGNDDQTVAAPGAFARMGYNRFLLLTD